MYRTYRQEVLSKVLCNQITQGDGSLQDPIAALFSTPLRSRGCESKLTGIVPFLDRYKNSMFGYDEMKSSA